MSALKKLYQQAILKHNREPENFGALQAPTHQARGLNALCGDDLTVQLKLENERIADIAFQGDACAISMASASLMTSLMRGKHRDEALRAFAAFEQLMAGEIEESPLLGEANVLAGVRAFPARIKSARLPWHALRAALQGEAQVSTET